MPAGKLLGGVLVAGGVGEASELAGTGGLRGARGPRGVNRMRGATGRNGWVGTPGRVITAGWAGSSFLPVLFTGGFSSSDDSSSLSLSSSLSSSDSLSLATGFALPAIAFTTGFPTGLRADFRGGLPLPSAGFFTGILARGGLPEPMTGFLAGAGLAGVLLTGALDLATTGGAGLGTGRMFFKL